MGILVIYQLFGKKFYFSMIASIRPSNVVKVVFSSLLKFSNIVLWKFIASVCTFSQTNFPLAVNEIRFFLLSSKSLSIFKHLSLFKVCIDR